MSRIAIRRGSIVRCDAPTCSEQFVTYSIQRLVRRQARAAGWDRVRAWQLEINDSPRRKFDACPLHGTMAAAVKERRLQDKADRRASLQAARILLLRTPLVAHLPVEDSVGEFADDGSWRSANDPSVLYVEPVDQT